jgi:hypothetical protein
MEDSQLIASSKNNGTQTIQSTFEYLNLGCNTVQFVCGLQATEFSFITSFTIHYDQQFINTFSSFRRYIVSKADTVLSKNVN